MSGTHRSFWLFQILFIALFTGGCNGSASPSDGLPGNSVGTAAPSIVETIQVPTSPEAQRTLGSELVVQFSNTQQASMLATATAWAALPINIGTPTVPAPRPDGIDLDDATSWVRHSDATGFAFDVMNNATVAGNSTDNSRPDINAVLQVGPIGEVPPSPISDEYLGVSISRRGDPVISDRNFPRNLTNNQGTANWLSQFPFSESAQVTMYVHGMMNSAPNPVNLDFWMFMSPTLYVNVLDERCNASITFFTSFGMPGPAADALAEPLDQVVAEHFPVLDHMYRSVEFPPECS